MFDIKLKLSNNKINFGEEQLEALSKLKEFVDSKELTITLAGAAGSGKTSITSEFISYLNSIGKSYILAAPTHKAKLVLETISGEQACTIHQLLALKPNLDILDLDFRELDFFSNQSKKPNQIPYKGIVIIDEASMVNDDLFDFIVDKCKYMKAKIIFVGE